jgi:hypothetical protein
MLEFIKKAFRKFLEIILWINLVLSVIVGGVAGNSIGGMISYRGKGGYTFLGILIGLIIGVITDIIMGGFIATILNIDKNLEELKNKQS